MMLLSLGVSIFAVNLKIHLSANSSGPSPYSGLLKHTVINPGQ